LSTILFNAENFSASCVEDKREDPKEVGAPANRIELADGEALTPRNERPRTGIWAEDLVPTTKEL
jgi:hypothetical protein